MIIAIIRLVARSKTEQIVDEYYIETVDNKEVLFFSGKESTHKFIGGIFVATNRMVKYFDTYFPLFKQGLLIYQPLY